MPFYTGLKRLQPTDRERAAERLVLLRERLSDEIPAKTVRNTLLLGTWNIREFDSKKYGGRLPESFYYIAEIISRLDLVAVQEVRRDLGPLRRVMDILGGYWDFLVTDVTEGVGGNEERIAFVYDTRKVHFAGVAGEIVLPKNDRIKGDIQFARTPFVVSFQARWFKFNLCSVHIYYGSDYGDKLSRRIDEIDAIAEFFKKRAKKEPENYILLGDFNIIDPSHETMAALLRHGFIIPQAIQDLPTNIAGTKHYDQIAFRPSAGEVDLGPSNHNAGAFDYYDTVFTADDHEAYKPHLKEDVRDDPKHYLDWRTYQMSDHLPMWVELEVDYSDRYLNLLK